MEQLKAQGFEVDTFDYSVHFPNPNETMQSFIDKYDAAIYVLSEGTSSNQTTVRLTWNLPLANDAPWFINDIPTIAISFANPYHLRDMPELGTYINAYTTNDFNVEAVVEKLMGKERIHRKRIQWIQLVDIMNCSYRMRKCFKELQRLQQGEENVTKGTM